MAVHNLKSWFWLFQAHLEGEKPFEYRRNDRDYKAGDTLHLEEYNQYTGTKTGRTMNLFVLKIWDSSSILGLPKDFVIMSVGSPPKPPRDMVQEVLAQAQADRQELAGVKR